MQEPKPRHQGRCRHHHLWMSDLPSVEAKQARMKPIHGGLTPLGRKLTPYTPFHPRGANSEFLEADTNFGYEFTHFVQSPQLNILPSRTYTMSDPQSWNPIRHDIWPQRLFYTVKVWETAHDNVAHWCHKTPSGGCQLKAQPISWVRGITFAKMVSHH